MTFIRRTVYLGKRAVVLEYPAPAYGKNRQKPKRKGNTSEEQQQINDRIAAARLQGKIACNFDANKDVFLTLTHLAKTSEEEARTAIRKYLRAMRRWNPHMKYICVTEKQGVWNHHLIMSWVDPDFASQLWREMTSARRTTFSTLDEDENYWDLAWYLVTGEKPSRKENPDPDEAENAKKPRKRGQRRWTCSKGLLEPEETEEVFLRKMNRKPPKLDRDRNYKLISDEVRADSFGFLHRRVEYVWCGKGLPPVYKQIEKNKKQEKRDRHERDKAAQGDGGADPGGAGRKRR